MNVSQNTTACFCMVAEGSKSQGDTPTFKRRWTSHLDYFTVAFCWKTTVKMGLIKYLPRVLRPSILVREYHKFIDQNRKQ